MNFISGRKNVSKKVSKSGCKTEPWNCRVTQYLVSKKPVPGVRMLTDEVEDATEAEALEFRRSYIDIYSSSWGPVDNGEKVDGPGLLVKTAFEEVGHSH